MAPELLADLLLSDDLKKPTTISNPQTSLGSMDCWQYRHRGLKSFTTLLYPKPCADAWVSGRIQTSGPPSELAHAARRGSHLTLVLAGRGAGRGAGRDKAWAATTPPTAVMSPVIEPTIVGTVEGDSGAGVWGAPAVGWPAVSTTTRFRPPPGREASREEETRGRGSSRHSSGRGRDEAGRGDEVDPPPLFGMRPGHRGPPAGGLSPVSDRGGGPVFSGA
jgi:hypothetical protein